MLTLKWGRLIVRQLVMVAVGLVGGRQDDLLHGGAPPACVEKGPRPADVRLEGRYRIAIGYAYDRLCRQMNDRVDLVFAERTFEQSLIADVTANDLDPVGEVASFELTPRHAIANQTDDVGARGNQALHQPRAHEARRARDQDGAILPEGGQRLSHTRQGAAPRPHMSLRRTYSRYVSIAKKKPSCL